MLAYAQRFPDTNIIWITDDPFFAGIALRKHIYDFMYAEISSAVKGKSVLELATGPGMIARHIAPSAKAVIATDFSPKMIETAQNIDLFYAECAFLENENIGGRI